MYQPEVYIKRTLAGYYVCYSALPRRIVNNRPYRNMSDAMRTAWEAVASYRTRQSTIYVH